MNPAFFSPIQSVKRKSIAPGEKEALLEAQHNRCFYCGMQFGEFFMHGEDLVKIKPAFDHTLPYIFFYNNKPSNFVAACVQCNGIKSAKVIMDVEERIDYVRRRREEKNLPMSELWRVLQTKKKLAKVLYDKMSERFLLENAQGGCDSTKLSDWKLAIYIRGLKSDKRIADRVKGAS